MKREDWPKIGTQLYFVCEYVYDHGHMKYVVCSGELIRYNENSTPLGAATPGGAEGKEQCISTAAIIPRRRGSVKKGERKMRRLCANKTKLYKLVAEFEPLPPVRRVTYVKAYRQQGYWLRWADSQGMLCKAYLCSCMGRPLLSIEKEEFCGPATSRVIHGLNEDELARRGMVEEITTAAERKRLTCGTGGGERETYL